MGGSCDTDATNSEIAAAVLTIPQTLTTDNLTGTITYEYHTHDSSCYKLCNNTTAQHNRDGKDLEDNLFKTYSCTVCGADMYTMKYDSNGNYVSTSGNTTICKNSVLICGYTNGQLIGATIIY